MSAYLLDTHVVVDLSNEEGFEKIPPKVRRILDDSAAELFLSVVSEAEIAIKFRLNKLDLSQQELTTICSGASIQSLPLRQRHVRQLFELPKHHKDPFDRMIISTALVDGIPVISRDDKFHQYQGLEVIWI